MDRIRTACPGTVRRLDYPPPGYAGLDVAVALIESEALGMCV